MIAYMDGTALRIWIESSRAWKRDYQTGMSGPAMIPETRLMALNMRRERVAALRERETAATDLMLLTADVAPPASRCCGSRPRQTNHNNVSRTVGPACRRFLRRRSHSHRLQAGSYTYHQNFRL